MKKIYTLSIMALCIQGAMASNDVLCNLGKVCLPSASTTLNIPTSTPPFVPSGTSTTINNIKNNSTSSANTPVATASTPKKTVSAKKVKIAQSVEQVQKSNDSTISEIAKSSKSSSQDLFGGLSGLFDGSLASVLQVGAVIAQETGDEKTAKYLLGAGGIVGAGDVIKDVANGTADAGTALKGVAAAGSIYAATSGDENKVQDFGRGAAILGSAGAYISGDFNSVSNTLFGSKDASGKTSDTKGILNGGSGGILDTASSIMKSDTTQILLSTGAGIAAQSGNTNAARVLTGASAVGSGMEALNVYTTTGRVDVLNTGETIMGIYGASSKKEGTITAANGGMAIFNVLENVQNGQITDNNVKSSSTVATTVFGNNNSALGGLLGGAIGGAVGNTTGVTAPVLSTIPILNTGNKTVGLNTPAGVTGGGTTTANNTTVYGSPCYNCKVR